MSKQSNTKEVIFDTWILTKAIVTELVDTVFVQSKKLGTIDLLEQL